MTKKDKILKSVLKLVNRAGFYHLSMKKIASEAGIAAGTIYLYFKGKEELINDLYSMAVAETNEAVLSVYDKEKPVLESAQSMAVAYMNFFLSRPDYFSFIEQYTYAPMLFKENQDQNFTLLRPVMGLLRKGKQSGIFQNLPDEILISIIHGSINTAVKMHLAKKYDLSKPANQNKFFNALWQLIITN